MRWAPWGSNPQPAVQESPQVSETQNVIELHPTEPLAPVVADRPLAPVLALFGTVAG